MHWVIFPIISILIIIVCFFLVKLFKLNKYHLTVLDLIAIPGWILVHLTLGYRFGISIVGWLLLMWWVVGLFLFILLTKKGWSISIFWSKYWQWTSILSYFMLYVITIVGLFIH